MQYTRVLASGGDGYTSAHARTTLNSTSHTGSLKCKYERYVIRRCGGGLTDDIRETLATTLNKEIKSQLTFL